MFCNRFRILDEKDFILKDDNGERLYGMSLSQSIDRAQAKPLFQVGVLVRGRNYIFLQGITYIIIYVNVLLKSCYNEIY